MSSSPEVSIVIPVYNEQGNLPTLFSRIYPVLDSLQRRYEIIFTNDGSADRSREILAEQFHQRPDVTRVIDFNANYGQHMAVMAGLEHARGKFIITLDADLQNPPEEIPKLLAKLDEGYDCVGGVRQNRQDQFYRKFLSRWMNCLRHQMTKIKMSDQGCMLRGYSAEVVAAIVRSQAVNTFIPALAYNLAQKPTEVEVSHEERHAGVSNYSFYALIRLNFDLITSFTTVPLQIFTIFAMLCSIVSFALVLELAYRRISLGPEEGGLFTLVGIIIFLISVCMLGIGLIGEYVGRTYQVVRKRTRYHIREILEQKNPSTPSPLS